MDYIKRMRDLREDRDKTQQEIARVLGTSQTMYARYERGANELPIRHLVTLMQVLRGQRGLSAGAERRNVLIPKRRKIWYNRKQQKDRSSRCGGAGPVPGTGGDKRCVWISTWPNRPSAPAAKAGS